MADVSPAPAPGGGRILGMPRRTALIVLGVTVAGAAAYFLWKRHQSSASASSGAVSSTASGGYGVDYGGELSVIQSELEDLLAASGQPATSGSGTGTGTGGSSGGSSGPGNCPGGFTWNPVTSQCEPAKGEQGTGGSSGGSSGGGTGTKTQTKPKPGTPAAVHATKTTSNAVTLAWAKAPNATSYRVRATYQGKLVGSQQSVNGTSATISGLHPDHTYTFHVASIGPGGTSAETNGPAVKTSR